MHRSTIFGVGAFRLRSAFVDGVTVLDVPEDHCPYCGLVGLRDDRYRQKRLFCTCGSDMTSEMSSLPGVEGLVGWRLPNWPFVLGGRRAHVIVYRNLYDPLEPVEWTTLARRGSPEALRLLLSGEIDERLLLDAGRVLSLCRALRTLLSFGPATRPDIVHGLGLGDLNSGEQLHRARHVDVALHLLRKRGVLALDPFSAQWHFDRRATTRARRARP